MTTLISSPHAHGRVNVAQLMMRVIYALIPAIVVYAWLFGPGVIINIVIAAVACLASEATVLSLRGRQIRPALSDGSALAAAVLLGLALPPLAPWWLIVVGSLFAIAFVKHLYGGLGQNPFNPAMAAYVLLLVAFPRAMTSWPAPLAHLSHPLSLIDSLRYIFTGALPAGMELDAITSATALDFVKTELHRNQTMHEILASPIFGTVAGRGMEIVNGLVLGGGLWLIYKRVITWHAPVGLLGSLALLAAIFYAIDPDTHLSPLFHLFSGGAILGAFFISTDPTTGATSNRGRLLFGIGVGALTYVIRTWGSYPEGIAFAVLLMNMAAPTIDYYTQPRVYGHGG